MDSSGLRGRAYDIPGHITRINAPFIDRLDNPMGR